MKQEKAPVLWNEKAGPGCFRIGLGCHPDYLRAVPGQFVMVQIGDGCNPLLRRPFSIHRLIGDEKNDVKIELLYKVVGAGTAALSDAREGDGIGLLGPLGRGFSISKQTPRTMIVAGGIGVAPFPALLASLRAAGGPRPRMFYGGRSAGDLPLLDWFRDRTDVDVTTDDGSLGRRGLVTEPLAEFLDAEDPEAVKLYVCGPDPMLRAAARIALERGLDCELSLEAHMACGFGVCLGCVVPTRRPGQDEITYDRVCKEGPVMRPEVLAW